MRPRNESRPVALEMRAVYSIGQLAHAANVKPDFLRRLLRASGIVFLPGGRELLVPLVEIRTKIPPLWDSLLLMGQHPQRASKERLRV